VLRNVDLMLQYNLIHGDLSAYNILYWQGEITIIDFPQVVNLHANPKAHFILRRDIQRTCEYFIQQGVRCSPASIMDEMWRRYVAEPDPEDVAADWSRLAAALDEMSDGVTADPVPAW
jgi:RIO kinase 1